MQRTKHANQKRGTGMKTRLRQAFTLVELLTVIAITAVLLTVIVLPIVQTFNLTRTAQAFQEAQDRARIVTERISREMSNSAGVRDNTGFGGQVNIVVPSGPGSARAIVQVPLNYAKVDLLSPAQEGIGDINNGYVDPNTGKVDPSLKAPKGQIALPGAPGTTLLRYFIGRHNPFVEYNNPYQVWNNNATDGAVLKTRSGGRDNLYLLFRAEVPVYVPVVDNRPGAPVGSRRMVVNTAFFDVQPGSVAPGDPDPRAGTPVYDDPNFFEPNRTVAGVIIANDAKAIRIQNWLDKASVQTEISRYDMIQPFFDKNSRKVVFDPVTDVGGNEYAPRLMSLVAFRPTRVSEGAAEGQLAIRPGDETDNASAIAPDVYLTKSAAWSNASVVMYPVFNRPSPLWTSADPFAVGHMPYAGQPNAPSGFSIYGQPGGYTGDPTLLGTELFDVAAYENAVSLGQRYPFNRALLSADSRSNWYTNAGTRATFMPVFAPYLPDGNLGKITASFSITDFGNINNNAFVGQNMPSVYDGPEVTPANDVPASPPTYQGSGLAAINTGTFSDPAFASINRKFNKVWFDYPSLRPDIHRFIDLRVTPQMDGSLSPMDPTSGFPRARIVPGSEEVYGPDQRPGPNYGNIIRFTRTTTATVGPNQYRINYVDQHEPDFTDPGLGIPSGALAGFNPNVYDATNFVSAVYQPRFKAGYIQLNSDPNVPLPVDNASTPANEDAAVSVLYKVQFTQAVRRPGQPSGMGIGDTFAVEYDSRQLMTVQVTIRNYPQTTLPTIQTVTLKSEAPIRNFLR